MLYFDILKQLIVTTLKKIHGLMIVLTKTQI